MILSLLVCLVLDVRAHPLPDADQFGRLIRLAHEPIRDFDFIYEGEEWRFKDGQRHREIWFQGCYAHSRDGHSHLELYQHDYSKGASEMSRMTLGLQGHELFERFERSDRGSPSDTPLRYTGGPGVLSRSMSPEQIFQFSWFFDAFVDPADQGYEALGTEVVDGNLCQVVRMDITPGLGGGAVPHFVFWIDTERGWHPIRVENRGMNDEIYWRVTKVRLSEVKLPGGGTVWFPVGGAIEYFYLPEDGGAGRPVRFAEAAIVDDSLRINQNFREERFHVNYSRNPARGPLADAKHGFQLARQAAPPRTRPALDPESVRERLDTNLGEAERQGFLVEAVAPSSRFWTASRSFQTVALALGIATLIGAYLLVRRR
ncbi:hypothetical protein BH23PLA1_BH23PLA1_07130 [soil metagenome]